MSLAHSGYFKNVYWMKMYDHLRDPGGRIRSLPLALSVTLVIWALARSSWELAKMPDSKNSPCRNDSLPVQNSRSFWKFVFCYTSSTAEDWWTLYYFQICSFCNCQKLYYLLSGTQIFWLVFHFFLRFHLIRCSWERREEEPITSFYNQ